MIVLLCPGLRMPYDIAKDLRLLGCETAFAMDMLDFLDGVRERDCSVYVADNSGAKHGARMLLRRLAAASGEPDADCWPVVLVAEDAVVDRSIAQVTVPPTRLRTELLDAVSQEVARAVAGCYHMTREITAMGVETV